jgi:hypothetical protein
MPDTHDRILQHYREFWGADRVADSHWTPEHLGSRLPDFHIAKVAPATQDGMRAFASIGAWRATEGEERGLEFIVAAPSLSAAVMHRLGMVAYYHAGPTENRLGAGHRLPVGEPWVEGSELDTILLSLPYPWGPRLEHCQLPDRHIQVLWVLPITSAESAFARENGVEALEQRFDDAKIDYLDPFRASVA